MGTQSLIIITCIFRSFWGFAEHFKDQADALMNQLDAAKQKSLQGELSLSSSNNSLNNGDKPASAGRVRVRSASQDRGYESSTLGFVFLYHKILLIIYI